MTVVVAPSYDEAIATLDSLLGAGESFDTLEEAIEAMGFEGEEAAALWLYAYCSLDTRSRRREMKDTLRMLEEARNRPPPRRFSFPAFFRRILPS